MNPESIHVQMVADVQPGTILSSASSSSSKRCGCPFLPREVLCCVSALEMHLCSWSCVCSEQDCIRVKAKKLTSLFSFFLKFFGLTSLPVKTSKGHMDKMECGWFKERRIGYL